VDARRPPERVGEAHPTNQITDFSAHLRPSGTARSPPPVEPKAFAMPLDHGCWLDQHHGAKDLRPNVLEPNPENTVGEEKLKPASALPPKDMHLISQGHELMPQ
jgi:hypothetical protein